MSVPCHHVCMYLNVCHMCMKGLLWKTEVFVGAVFRGSCEQPVVCAWEANSGPLVEHEVLLIDGCFSAHVYAFIKLYFMSIGLL